MFSTIISLTGPLIPLPAVSFVTYYFFTFIIHFKRVFESLKLAFRYVAIFSISISIGFNPFVHDQSKKNKTSLVLTNYFYPLESLFRVYMHSFDWLSVKLSGQKNIT